MSRTQKVAAAALALLCLSASAPSSAHRQSRAPFRAGIYVGAPWHRPAIYPPAYYPYVPNPTTVVVPGDPITYVERSTNEPDPNTAELGQATTEIPLANQWWYFCHDSQAFYPTVQQCNSPWQPVAPQP